MQRNTTLQGLLEAEWVMDKPLCCFVIPHFLFPVSCFLFLVLQEQSIRLPTRDRAVTCSASSVEPVCLVDLEKNPKVSRYLSQWVTLKLHIYPQVKYLHARV
jgi:hypothetical protein